MANRNLSAAKKAKNDEFYTRFTDINSELKHYEKHFKDKIVYCNCDDGQWSNFWKFFYANFEIFEMKKLIATSYHDGISHTGDSEDIAYKYVYEGGYGKTDFVKNNYMEGVTKTRLEGNGDFRSEECIEILKESDIVVTNPPFSLFKEFIGQLEEYNKKYIIWGNTNAVTYKEVFPLIKNNKLWSGFMFNKTCLFQIPDWYEKYDVKNTEKINDGLKYANVPSIAVFTNLNTNKRHHIYECYSRYNETDYPKYDNFNAINVGKVCDIPCDYTGVMGVPITFLDKYCSEQFEIIDCTHTTNPELLSNNHELNYYRNFKRGKVVTSADPSMPLITSNVNEGTKCVRKEDGAIIYQLYHRLFIRWKPEAMPHIYDNGVILYE